MKNFMQEGGIVLVLALLFCFILAAVLVPIILFVPGHNCEANLLEFQGVTVKAVGNPVDASGFLSGPSYSVIHLSNGQVLPISRWDMHLYKVGATYNMGLSQSKRSGTWSPTLYDCGYLEELEDD